MSRLPPLENPRTEAKPLDAGLTVGFGSARGLPDQSPPQLDRGLSRRELVVESILAAGVLVASAALSALVPAQRPLSLALAAGLLAFYAAASRITFDVGAGFAVPTQLALVPMLFVLPAPLVPLIVAGALWLGVLPEQLRGRAAPARGVVAVADAWHAVGPAIVFALAGVREPTWAEWPVYVAAFAAQCGFDVAASIVRERVGRDIPVGLQLRVLGWVYLVDALLTPTGYLVVVAAGSERRALALALPLAALLAILARDRSARIREAHGSSRAYHRAAVELRVRLGELRESEERFRLLVESVEDYAIFMLDPAGRVASWNQGAERIMGYRPHEIIGTHLSAFYPPADVERGAPEIALATARDRGRCEEEAARLRKDGSPFVAHVFTTALVDEGGRLRGYSQVTRDVTERRRLEAALAHQALHDALTGLANRALFLEELKRALTRSERRAGLTAVLFVDLDRFKIVNDSLGHLAGDHLLVAVAKRLKAAVRAGDTVARLGGDEFTVLCEDISEADTVAIARRISDALAAPLRVQSEDVFVTASVGIAFARDRNADPEVLLGDADAAMYRAKGHGGPPYEIFEKRMRSGSGERLRLETALRRGIERGDLRVVYQPQVDLATGRLAGVEALVRWRRGPGDIVAPAEFIPLAEETGLIVPIGAFVLREACRQAARWNKRRPDGRPLAVAINLSPAQVSDADFLRTVEDALVTSGANPVDICLEITESMLISDLASAGELMTSLNALGVRLAIDDFGTGYASLSTLRRFPVSVLKIDGSFVRSLGRSATDSALVSAVTGMGHALALAVVAEWVDSASQVTELRSFGCDFGQGHYFSPARPASALDGLVEEDPRWLTAPDRERALGPDFAAVRRAV